MKHYLKLFLILSFIFPIFLSGCLDVKEIQNLNYATAIGVDYKDGNYHFYIQMNSLSPIAKSEGISGAAEVWVAEGIGKTFIDAIFDIYSSSQQRILWAHVRSLVLSEAALEEGFDKILDGFSRYHEFRMTPWVFGTKEPIEEILSTVGFFQGTALDTLLHFPIGSFQQDSEIRPIRLHQFAKELFEKGYTTFIPSISINKEQ